MAKGVAILQITHGRRNEKDLFLDLPRRLEPNRLGVYAQSMNPRAKFGFLAIVVAQAMHSTEEYVTQLYEGFAPARLF